MVQRYSTAGLAHSAADARSRETGERWVMAFRPRGERDEKPFVIELRA